MPQVLAWKCPATSKLFEDKKKYVAHLRVTARERIEQKKQERIRKEQVAFFRNMRKTVSTVEQLEQFVKDNWEFFVRANISRDAWRAKQKRYRLPKLVYLDIELRPMQLRQADHSHPMTVKWGGPYERDKKPWFNAWHGKFTWIVDGETPGFPSAIWEQTGVMNDGGGSSSSVPGRKLKANENCYWGSITLWEPDWPAMSEKEMLLKLAPNRDPNEVLV